MKKSHIFFYFIFLTNLSTYANHPIEETNKEIIQKTYQLMKDLNDIFSFYKIEYWIQGSTLMGSVRFHGLIPWLDSLDICIEKSNEEKFLLTIPTFNLLGYKTIKIPFGYRMFPNDGFSIEDNEKPWKYPFCDICLMVRHKDRIYYHLYIPNAPKRDSGRPYLKASELFPLTKYLFGSIIVTGPNNPFKYLELWYGSNWYTNPLKTSLRSGEKKLDSISLCDFTKAVKPESTLVDRFIIPDLKECSINF